MKVALKQDYSKKYNKENKKKNKINIKKRNKRNKVFPSEILIEEDTEEKIPCCAVLLMLCFFGTF
tara:strand:- start:432 stop:626 length:195 start_codon:yes stop_codon:yes gene_type:complete